MRDAERCRLSRRAAVMFILLLLPVGACQMASDSSGKSPQPARRGLSEDGRMQISPGDRCPVCAMPVDEHEAFSAAIVLSDRAAFYFCTPGCMLRAWLMPARYLNRTRDELLEPVVREYFSGDVIDARRAHWVSGSDVIGPMGPALAALSSEDDVTVFRRRHGGNHGFRLSQLSAENWKEMIGGRSER